MKKKIYIFFVVILVVLVQFLLHALVELPVTKLLYLDFATYSLGFSWATWFLIHHVFVVLLFLIAIPVGVALGHHWYRLVYIEGKRFHGFKDKFSSPAGRR
jgi:hypothetical protein